MRNYDVILSYYSVVIAVKFLLFHFLVPALDLWEALLPLNIGLFNNAVAISNFLVLIDACTNCLIYLRWKFVKMGIKCCIMQKEENSIADQKRSFISTNT